jgi:putative PIN family toxin of toxin-antitoxin system
VNVLVSAFISKRGAAPDRIVRAWREGVFELVVSPKLIAELVDVLDRPKFEDQAGEGRAQAFVAALVGDALWIEDPADPPSVLLDADDDYLLALAGVAGADAIVSGDGHLTRMEGPVIEVMTPVEFFASLA